MTRLKIMCQTRTTGNHGIQTAGYGKIREYYADETTNCECRKSNSPMRLMSKVHNALITEEGELPLALFSIPEICRSFWRRDFPAAGCRVRTKRISSDGTYNLRHDIRSLRINDRKAYADAIILSRVLYARIYICVRCIMLLSIKEYKKLTQLIILK